MIRLSPDQAAQWLAERARRVFIPAGAAEPLALFEAFKAQPGLAAGITFVGAFLPGANRSDWGSLGRAEGTFASADWRESLEAGRFTFTPLTYFQTFGWLEATPLDAAVFHVSPAQDGRCSLGVATDLSPAVMDRDVLKVGLVNAAMPATRGPSIPLDAFDVVVEIGEPLATYDAGALDPAFDAISRTIAELTPEGASVQFGIGKAGVAALAALKGRKGLKIHSGMVTDPLLEVLDSGALEEVVTGLALGTRPLFERCATDRRIRFEPASFTHDIRTLAGIPRLVAVNSALEVDLFGQANAEFIGGRQVSGVGGLTDFLRGARLSEGGVPIVALNATAKGRSRIVPRLAPNAVSVPRADMGVVVTEHGQADLRGLSLDDRAQALIATAAPEHRDALSNEWDEMRRSL
ncbi:MAG TPA: acetyl-CoA hydrolase/transferase C-terminal domain-containing protein [Caulobacteraceae bacterium]|nr:acetyl-CoA hydrolase/transferase C-terminal domain-containing protein [Caulobacteraceae bacterium]